MELQVWSSEDGKSIGTIVVPDEIIEAARKVEEWLREHNAIELYGLQLATD